MPDILAEPSTCNLELGEVVPIPRFPAEVIANLSALAVWSKNLKRPSDSINCQNLWCEFVARSNRAAVVVPVTFAIASAPPVTSIPVEVVASLASPS